VTGRGRLAALVLLLLQGALLGCARHPPIVAAPPPLSPVERLRRDIDTLLDRPGHRHGIWGVAIESLERQDTLFARNARTLLVPASTIKLVTVAAAAEAAGWDYTFETTLLAGGPIAGGAVHGDLLIVGSGDPSFGGRPDGENAIDAWIQALRDRGVSRVEGRIVADDGAADEPKPGFAWSWEDLGFTYGAMPGALNFAENAFRLTVSPGAAPGLHTIVEIPDDARELPFVNASVTAEPGSATLLWPEYRPGEAALTLHGTMAADASPAVLSVSAGNPTLWFARAVRNRLRAAGIDPVGAAVDGDDVADKPDGTTATVLATHRSPPLSAIAEPLLEESINLYAEAVLRLATGPDGPRTTDAALDAVRLRLQAWGVPPEEVQIVDGSGLSRRNVITPNALVTLLRRSWDAAGESPWMRALPVAGREGTLAARMQGTPAEGNARAKSGSMSNIRTLAGYVRTVDGEPLAYAIMANNFEGPASGVVATIDAVVARLAAFTR